MHGSSGVHGRRLAPLVLGDIVAIDRHVVVSVFVRGVVATCDVDRFVFIADGRAGELSGCQRYGFLRLLAGFLGVHRRKATYVVEVRRATHMMIPVQIGTNLHREQVLQIQILAGQLSARLCLAVDLKQGVLETRHKSEREVAIGRACSRCTWFEWQLAGCLGLQLPFWKRFLYP